MTTTPFRVEVESDDLLVGLVEARGISERSDDPELASKIDAALLVRRGGVAPSDERRTAIRDLLRRGGFKPTGRSKPASEYLGQAADRDEFPRIAPAVDVCNLVSLETGLPISLVDTDLALEGTTGLVLRLGRAEESYVFNAAGHAIDVEGLLCVAREDGAPVGNPVKDSLATKVTPTTRNVLAVVYGSRAAVGEDEFARVLDRLGDLFRAHCGAEVTTR